MPEIFRDAADLQRKFNQHGHAVRRKILNQVVRAGAEIIREKAERLAPRDTGQLAEEELIRIVSSQSSAAEVIARIGPAKSSFYGLFQEFGTAHHAAQPFLLPAVEETKDLAAQASNTKLIEGLEAIG